MRNVGLLLMIALFSACGGSSFELPTDNAEGPISLVQEQPVQRGAVTRSLVSTAVVESVHLVDLVPQATGTVRSVWVDEGDAVRSGQLLAVLENVTLASGSERAASELKQLEAELVNKEQLYADGAISAKELSDLRFRVQAARISQTEAAHQAVQTRILAPFSGVISRRDIREGEWFSGGKPAFQIVDLSKLKAVASLPERDLSQVRVGQSAHLSGAYQPDQRVQATVSRIAPVVDPTTGTFRVTLSVAEGETSLRPGQFVSVEVDIERREGVIIAPKQAVVWEDGRSVFFRRVPAPPDTEKEDEKPVKEPSFFASFFGSKDSKKPEKSEKKIDLPAFVAERVIAELGLQDADTVEVISGLKEGDALIVVGQSHLTDGAAVRTEEMQAEYFAKKKQLEEEEAERDAEESP